MRNWQPCPCSINCPLLKSTYPQSCCAFVRWFLHVPHCCLSMLCPHIIPVVGRYKMQGRTAGDLKLLFRHRCVVQYIMSLGLLLIEYAHLALDGRKRRAVSGQTRRHIEADEQTDELTFGTKVHPLPRFALRVVIIVVATIIGLNLLWQFSRCW